MTSKTNSLKEKVALDGSLNLLIINCLSHSLDVLPHIPYVFICFFTCFHTYEKNAWLFEWHRRDWISLWKCKTRGAVLEVLIFIVLENDLFLTTFRNFYFFSTDLISIAVEMKKVYWIALVRIFSFICKYWLHLKIDFPGQQI